MSSKIFRRKPKVRHSLKSSCKPLAEAVVRSIAEKELILVSIFGAECIGENVKTERKNRTDRRFKGIGVDVLWGDLFTSLICLLLRHVYDQ